MTENNNFQKKKRKRNKNENFIGNIDICRVIS